MSAHTQITNKPGDLSIVTIENCTAIYGPIPIDYFAKAAKDNPNAVFDSSLADLLDASFVYGLPDDLKKLRLSAPDRKIDEALFQNCHLFPGARKWLARGERGLSSKYLLWELTGYSTEGELAVCTPHDAYDLRRCILMLETCELESTFDVFWLTGEWYELQKNWKELVATFKSEVPNYVQGDHVLNAPKTDAMLDAIYKEHHKEMRSATASMA